MLLTLSTTTHPATDLGFLLHKNPARLHEETFSFGKAFVFYPEATEERCTAALLLEVDPIGLVRGRKGPEGEGGLLAQYVNDRPYCASSFMSVALSGFFSTAMNGRSKERQALAETPIPLEARLPSLSCRGGEKILRKLFEPLGYELDIQEHPLDPLFADWGASPILSVTLRSTRLLSDLLRHLYVLIPVMDLEKHYWVGEDEVEKLLAKVKDWLASHPEKELIAYRYLKRQRRLARAALERLLEEEPDQREAEAESLEESSSEDPATVRLHELRLDAVLEKILEAGPKTVLDLGCGEGKLLRRLLGERSITRIVGMDVAHRSLEIAANRLHLDRLSDKARERIELLHGSLMYGDGRLAGFDAAALVEVIEHLDPPRLAAFEGAVFRMARPKRVIITTPNREYNAKWATLPVESLRHGDHRFEWTRGEFQSWGGEVAERAGYRVELFPIGPLDPELGSPTQMAVFDRCG